jgi:hypothetical protein
MSSPCGQRGLSKKELDKIKAVFSYRATER